MNTYPVEIINEMSVHEPQARTQVH